MNTSMQKCANCSSTENREIFSAKDRHYKNPGEFSIVKCDNCQLVFLNPMPSNEILSTYYPTDFYAYQPYPAVSAFKKFVKSVLLMNIGTRDPQFIKPGVMLDLGCGSGEFINNKKNEGWQVFGVEPSPQAAEYGVGVRKLDIQTGTILDTNFSSNFFDYVRSNHSFEHINNPNETLQELHRILKPTGKLHIGVPNIESLNAKIFGRYWWYLGAPVHTFNYSVNTLSAIGKKHGFKVDRVIYNADFSGIMGSLQIWLNRNSNKTSIEGHLIKSKFALVLGQWLAKIENLFNVGDAIEITFVKDTVK